ncbi:excalibur calcium-binding domain-containing protein [Pseudoalteromonas sp. NZS71_1]|uniref:excalibur calcium-binding domain-containing protein n=1 Tax=Pseudoalteromonas sp. NZS71_1 TaxID=2792072 RepID=UPI0018CC8E6B|nr:excalibur calcium-binding domain-containing protein [Pseudoalteromonas sp. NZS71_1]MBH0034575.1 excalibur calcium-binding domain-containing protein [Pseudoalteromonas sp. NZS71_1]
MKHLVTLFFITTFSIYSYAGQSIWNGLVVEPEYRCSPYDKKAQYPYSQSVEDDIVQSMGGIVYGPYTGRYFDHDSMTDIEHIVAASEGHDSGLCSANENKRRQFATDLLNLTLAAPKINRCSTGGKCGFDPSEWLPEKNECWFANRIVEIKTKYELSVDREEANTLEAVLSKCDSFEMIFYLDEGAEHKNPPVIVDVLTLYDTNNNGRITCSEAREHGIAPVHSDHPAYEYMSDRDGDGKVCE